MIWLLVAVAVPTVYVACRDLRTNFRARDGEVWRGVAHSRARTASLVGAVVAPLLYPVSPVLAVVFCVASVALFWLVPNRMLAEKADRPPRSGSKRRGGS